MLKNTFISRASDGLILCETYDSVTDSQGMKSPLVLLILILVEKLKQKAKDLMKKIGYTNQMSTANVDDHSLQ